MNKPIFYYRNEHKKEGPFTEREFIEMIENHTINLEDEFWILQMENWMKMKDSIYVVYFKENQNCCEE